MSRESDSDGRSEASARNSAIGWLGFFLLVFAVAGSAFYFAGDSKVADRAKPAAVTQN